MWKKSCSSLSLRCWKISIKLDEDKHRTAKLTLTKCAFEFEITIINRSIWSVSLIWIFLFCCLVLLSNMCLIRSMLMNFLVEIRYRTFFTKNRQCEVAGFFSVRAVSKNIMNNAKWINQLFGGKFKNHFIYGCQLMSQQVGKSKRNINKEAIHYLQWSSDREKNGRLIVQLQGIR